MRNHQSLNIWKSLLLLFVLFSLCGCSSSAKSEKEIISDLQRDPAFISETVPIKNCGITKRQTDEKNNSDLVYITVYIDEGELKCTLSYVLRYVLYNEGWMLEEVARDRDGSWRIGGLTERQILATVQEKDEFFQKRKDVVIAKCEMSKLYDGNSEYEKLVDALVVAETENEIYQFNYRLRYCVEGAGWKNETLFTEAERWAPKRAPDLETIDDIGKSVQEDLEYDACAYSHMEEDLENNDVTIYYRAEKNFEFGMRVDVVSVHAKAFVNVIDDGSTHLLWLGGEPYAKLETIKWDIDGTWTASGTEGAEKWNVRLSIKNIQEVNGPEGEFSADVDCDASYDWGDYIVRCQTDGFQNVSIHSEAEEDIFGFTIWDSAGDWQGDFSIRLHSGVEGLLSKYDKQGGLYWEYSPGGIWLRRQEE